MEQLTVHAYNVLFGDAILIEVPDGGKTRFILIDVGNVLTGAPGADAPLLAAMQDITRRTGGHIALYIMTHEHLDHVQGLLYAKDHGCSLLVDRVWMTASSDPHYYEHHPDAQRQTDNLRAAVDACIAAFGQAPLPEEIAGIRDMNDRRKTADYVEYLRSMSPEVHYLHRQSDLNKAHDFKELKIRVLAPEENTADYYPRKKAEQGSTPRVTYPPSNRPQPVAGIDGGAFYNLIDRMNSGLVESLFTIDEAANNTSLVVEFEWSGRRLLFVGDAEQKSWSFMARNAGLKAVDFLKVGHHGSINGTPATAILDSVLPQSGRRSATAVVSTCPCAWKSVPNQPTLDAIAARTRKLYDTRTVAAGNPVSIRFTAAT